MHFHPIRPAWVVALTLLTAAPIAAQTCTPHWSEMFPTAAGGAARMLTWDPDGPGPLPETLHITTFAELSRWDGTRRLHLAAFTTIAFPYYGEILALARFDPDGAGPAPEELIVAGRFDGVEGIPASRIARWDGSTWSPLGTGLNNDVAALLVFDEDAGGPNPPRLFAAGGFTTAGGVTAYSIARWNGSSWSAVANPNSGASVGSLASFDADGAGPGAPVLVAAGWFQDIGGVNVKHIARWNGTTWSALGAGSNGAVGALAEYDADGPGPLPPRLFAANGPIVWGSDLASWDGTTWSAAGSFNGTVEDLHVHDDDGPGPGAPALYAGGDFVDVNGTTASAIARWDGTTWSEPGGGVQPGVGSCCPEAHCLASYDDDGSGPAPARLYVGGYFELAGGTPAQGLARWDGSAWLGMQRGLDNFGWSLAVADLDGAGPAAPALYVGGDFHFAAGNPANCVVRWDGATWSPLGSGLSAPTGYTARAEAMVEFDEDGGGPNPPWLFVGGEFDTAGGVPVACIARWDGSAWSDVGGGIAGPYPTVRALAVFDEDGPGPGAPALFAGGTFATAGGSSADSIARWNGNSWSGVGGGVAGGWQIECLTVADLGTGAKLYAGGQFTSVGGAAANCVASWDGTNWAALGSGTSSGLNPSVYSLHAADLDGPGPGPMILYAAGAFTTAGGILVNRVAAWNGSAWSALGAGLGALSGGEVYAVASLDPTGTGAGPRSLYAGGFFNQNLGGVDTWGLARWDGASWSSVGGLDTAGGGGTVTAMLLFDEDSGGSVRPALYMTGNFVSVGEVSSERIARLGCSIAQLTAFCFGDGSSGPCPCGNAGIAGAGCDNSGGTGGALLSATGDPSLAGDTLVLTSASEMPTAPSIVLQGNLTIPPSNFGDGLRCVGGNLKRLYVRSATAGVVVAPQGLEPRVSARSAALGDPIPIGGVRRIQTYYRDPNPGFCPAPPGNTWNVSNAVLISWNP